MGVIRIKEKKGTEKVRIGAAARAAEAQKTWVDDPKLLVATVRRWEREHAQRNGENRHYQRLYYQKPVVTQRISSIAEEQGLYVNDVLRRHGANLTAEVIDAGIALLCRRLQPKVLPVGGDYQQQIACKRTERVIEGVSDAGNWLSVFTEVARSGMYGDIGFALIDVDEATSEVKAWKLDPLYVFWPQDGTTTPRTVAVVMPVPKAKLIAQYPEKESEILALPTWRPRRVVGVDDMAPSSSDVDTVALVIGWALATGPNNPGKKVVAAGDIVFSNDDYKLDVHQVIPFRWKPNATGFAGVPLTRSVAPYDLTNKRILNRTLSALDGAVPWILHEEECDVESISDVEFQKVSFPRGSNPPQVVVPNPVSTQALDRMEANRAAAFREAHINESAATGQAPPGFKSAVAQFAWADSVQTILLPQQEEWQRMWRDAATVVVALMQTNQKARVRMGDVLEEVELPDLPRDRYKITFGLVSGLALTVSGRLEQLQQIQAALPAKLDNEDVLRHIGLPDTKQLADRLLAPRELAEYIVQQALDEGKMIMPPRMLGPDGLAALLRIANQEYCGALKKPRNYYPRKHLEVLRRVILATKWIMEGPAAPPPAPAPAPPVDPLAPVPPGAAGLPLSTPPGSGPPPGPAAPMMPPPGPGVPQ